MNRAKAPELTTFKFPIQNILSADGTIQKFQASLMITNWKLKISLLFQDKINSFQSMKKSENQDDHEIH